MGHLTSPVLDPVLLLPQIMSQARPVGQKLSIGPVESKKKEVQADGLFVLLPEGLLRKAGGERRLKRRDKARDAVNEAANEQQRFRWRKPRETIPASRRSDFRTYGAIRESDCFHVVKEDVALINQTPHTYPDVGVFGKKAMVGQMTPTRESSGGLRISPGLYCLWSSRTKTFTATFLAAGVDAIRSAAIWRRFVLYRRFWNQILTWVSGGRQVRPLRAGQVPLVVEASLQLEDLRVREGGSGALFPLFGLVQSLLIQAADSWSVSSCKLSSGTSDAASPSFSDLHTAGVLLSLSSLSPESES
ncbi:hypothetical protein EYF80_016741 [Liparis tanakae]|uniref:Uncharacterized protein n=1 Tax=Liparis tanakae TaxID=230148 RepID=A0A4Z2I5L9_9TELE|nr:hypothetical protein EYF80_016741 [Liparis tanakae]